MVKETVEGIDWMSLFGVLRAARAVGMIRDGALAARHFEKYEVWLPA